MLYCSNDLDRHLLQPSPRERDPRFLSRLPRSILAVCGKNGGVRSRFWACPIPEHWVAGLFELRIKAAEGIARVFYCTVVENRIVFLHQFAKKSEKTPSKELDIAQRRMKEVKHG